VAESYLIRFDVRPDQRRRFLDLLETVLDAMQHEETYIAAHLSEVCGNPNRFVLHEVWSSREDVVTTQLDRPYRKDWHAALPDLLLKDREIEVLSPVWPRRHNACG